MSSTDVTRSDSAADSTDEDPPSRTERDETGPDETVPDGEPSTRPRLRLPDPRTVRRIGSLLAPALIFLGIREFGLLVLMWMGFENNRSISEVLRSWDGQWFLAIADRGYAGVPPELVDAFNRRSAETPLAFFPGYPWLIRLVAAVDGPSGIGLVTAALTVTIVSGVVCAYALARLGRRIRGGSPRTGLILVALFASTPMAIVLSMAYSEALFCALAAWSLVSVLEKRWVLAGVCCSLAGLVRSTGAALVLAVGLVVLVAIMQRRDGWRPWLGGVIAPIGLVGYLAWVGVQTGEWNGWFALQERGWSTGFDGGRATLEFALEVLANGSSVLEVGTAALIVVALALLAIAIWCRVEWPLIVYTVGVLAMNLASNGLMYSKIRLMVPAFALLIPIALALAKRRPSTVVLTLCGLVVASSWFGAYSITAWGYAI